MLVVHGAAAAAEMLRHGAALVADADTCKCVSGVGANLLSVRGVAMRCGAMSCGAMRCDAMRCGAMRCEAMRCDAARVPVATAA